MIFNELKSYSRIFRNYQLIDVNVIRFKEAMLSKIHNEEEKGIHKVPHN